MWCRGRVSVKKAQFLIYMRDWAFMSEPRCKLYRFMKIYDIIENNTITAVSPSYNDFFTGDIVVIEQ